MSLNEFFLIWALYAFLVHALGRLSLRAIALENSHDGYSIKYKKENEIIQSWMALKILVDSNLPLTSSKSTTKNYIYAFRISMAAFPFFMLWFVVKYGFVY